MSKHPATRVWVEAHATVELNRAEIEVLSHLCSHGAGLVRAIRAHVTQQVSEEATVALVRNIQAQLAPAVQAIRAADKALSARTAPSTSSDDPGAIEASLKGPNHGNHE